MSDKQFNLEPKTPRQVSNYTRSTLQALVNKDLGEHIILGGAFGLAYYYEYRSTNDMDAWWEESAGNIEKRAVIECIENELHNFGEVRTRQWGDVVSVELLSENSNQVAFSFQIAQRTVRLQEPLRVPWPDKMKLDAFPDLLASKMVALVERGAPRDFRDIYTLCEVGLTSAEQSWDLWVERQRRSNGDTDLLRAKLAVQTHLARIEQQRPLNQIEDLEEKKLAERVREWFKEQFLDGLMD